MKSLIAVLVLSASLFYVAESLKAKFTNVECSVFDASFASVKKCYLKARARDVVSLHIHMQLHKLPVNNITLNAELFQKGNGYRPFLYNTTADFCLFLKKPHRYMFWKIIYDMTKPYTNYNHTCPFDEDAIFEGMILQSGMFKLIPFPANDYMLKFQFAAYNQYKFQIKAYVKLFD